MVTMLTSGFERWRRVEYRVVVLPLPVGPVTSTMPLGRSMNERTFWNVPLPG
jgi:hypothetical protein